MCTNSSKKLPTFKALLTDHFAPTMGASIMIIVYVCQCIGRYPDISQKLNVQTSPVSVLVVCGHGIVLWWECSTFCTSRFIDAVVFSHNGACSKWLTWGSTWGEVCAYDCLVWVVSSKSITVNCLLLFLSPKADNIFTHSCRVSWA